MKHCIVAFLFTFCLLVIAMPHFARSQSSQSTTSTLNESAEKPTNGATPSIPEPCTSATDSVLCVEALLDTADARYDIVAARAVIKIIKKQFPVNSHEFNYHMARVYEILSSATDAISGSRTRTNETFAITSLRYIEKALKFNSQHSDSYRIYSEMLGRRIYGASTGIKYDAISLAALDRALKLNPQNRRARLKKAIHFLQRPQKYGGNPDFGFRILKQLNQEVPQDTRVIFFLADYYRRKKNLSLYRRYLQQAVEINPRELPAVHALTEQRLQQRQIRIAHIGVRSHIRTSEKLLQRRLQKFVGEIFTSDTQSQIETALLAIPPIDGVSFYYTEVENGLRIDLHIDEDNMKLFNLAVGLNISLDANRNINWFFGEAPSAVFGMLYFESNNFFGSGDTFSLSSAAVYNDFRYQHFSRGPDSRFRFVFNAFPLEKYWYKNGERAGEEPYQYIWVQAEAGLGKSFELVDLFLMQAVKKEFYIKTNDYFKVPGEFITASTSLDASVNSIAYHDTFWLMDGIKLEVKPELILKPGYTQWGYEDQQSNHNDLPMFKLRSRVGLYKCLLKSIQLRGDLFYLYSVNPYLLELFPAGKDSVMDPFSMKLRGFYQEEFATSHALVANSLISFPLFSQIIRVGLLYDCAVFFEAAFQKGAQYKHGTGIQMLVKLPWNFEFVAQGALGLNAERNLGPGVEIDFYLSRLFVR